MYRNVGPFSTKLFSYHTGLTIASLAVQHSLSDSLLFPYQLHRLVKVTSPDIDKSV